MFYICRINPRATKSSQYTRGSVFKLAQFAPGACSRIFNRLNIVEHFAGGKFCSRGLSIPMKSLVHTEELCSRSVQLEHAPGAKSLVCIRLNSEKVLRATKCCNFLAFCMGIWCICLIRWYYGVQVYYISALVLLCICCGPILSLV